MICVAVEIREGVLTRRARITAPSIQRVLGLAGDGKPGCRVRLVFPIDPEVSSSLQILANGRRLEMGARACGARYEPVSAS